MDVIVTLVNCNNYFLVKGIDITKIGWQEILQYKLQGYLAFNGWSYDFGLDKLTIDCSEGTLVPDNITDFGEVDTNADYQG